MPSFIASVFLKKAKKSQMTEYIDIALSDLVWLWSITIFLNEFLKKKPMCLWFSLVHF